jgi:hypothetical protein
MQNNIITTGVEGPAYGHAELIDWTGRAAGTSVRTLDASRTLDVRTLGKLISKSVSSPLVGSGEFNDNIIKSLISLLSVEHED